MGRGRASRPFLIRFSGIFVVALAAICVPASAHASFESECSAAGGTAKSLANGKELCRCGAWDRTIDPRDSQQADTCRNRSYAPIVNQIENFNSPSTCSSCPQDGYANNQADSCDETLIGGLLADDKSGYWFTFGLVHSSAKECHQINDSSSPADLEKYLATDSRYRFGAGVGVVNGCFANASDPDKKQALAKYYYLNNRLRAADMASIESIASIDSMLGQEFAGSFGKDFEQRCGDPRMRDRSNACDFFASKCGPRGGLGSLVQQTKLALQAKDKLESEVSDFKAEEMAQATAASYGGSYSGQAQFQDYGAKIQDDENEIKDLEAANPWMSGKAFNSTEKKYSGSARYQDGAVQAMVRNQLVQDRDSLLKRLDSYKQATACLNDESANQAGLCKNFDEVIDDTPDLLLGSQDSSTTRDQSLAQYYMGQAQCRWDINDDAKAVKGDMEELIGNSALTIATAGLSSWAVGAKLAAEGVSAAKGLSQVALGADLALNAGFATTGGIQAYQACTKDLNQVGALARPSTDFSSQLSCPVNPYARTAQAGSEPAIGAPTVIADVRSCVTQSIAAAAGVLPFVPKALSDLRGGARAADELSRAKAAAPGAAEREAVAQAAPDSARAPSAVAAPAEQSATTTSKELTPYATRATGNIVPIQTAQKVYQENVQAAYKQLEQIVAQRGGNVSQAEQQRIFEKIYYRMLTPSGTAGRSAGSGGLLIFDTPVEVPGVPKSLYQRLNIDHHGLWYNAETPLRNSTVQALEVVDKTLSGPGTAAQKQALLNQYFKFVSTDNLGDGGWTLWIAQHLNEVESNPQLRKTIQQATEWEDFGAFGTKMEASATPAQQQAIDLQKAVFGKYSEIAKQHGLAADRFNMLPPATQKEIAQEAVKQIDQVLKAGPAKWHELAESFNADRADAAKLVAQSHDRVVSQVAENLPPAEKPAVDTALSKAYVYESAEPVQQKGVFATWSATPQNHSQPLQLNFFNVGNKQGFVLAVPDGETAPVDLSKFSQALRQLEISRGVPASQIAVGARGADLAFSFGGTTLSKQDILSVLGKELEEAKPAEVDAPSVVTLQPSEIKGSGQIAAAMKEFQSSNNALKSAVRSSKDPAAYLAALKKQIPPGNGLMRVVSPQEAENIIKEGGMGRGYDFGMTPTDARLGHGGNYILVRCADCKDIAFENGELGSSKINTQKIPADKLEFIVLKAPEKAGASAAEASRLRGYGLTDDQRVSLGEQDLRDLGLLKGNLSPIERAALRDHFGVAQDKAYYTQTAEEIHQKFRNAVKAGFTKQQADYLIREGYAGSAEGYQDASQAGGSLARELSDSNRYISVPGSIPGQRVSHLESSFPVETRYAILTDQQGRAFPAEFLSMVKDARTGAISFRTLIKDPETGETALRDISRDDVSASRRATADEFRNFPGSRRDVATSRPTRAPTEEPKPIAAPPVDPLAAKNAAFDQDLRGLQLSPQTLEMGSQPTMYLANKNLSSLASRDLASVPEKDLPALFDVTQNYRKSLDAATKRVYYSSSYPRGETPDEVLEALNQLPSKMVERSSATELQTLKERLLALNPDLANSAESLGPGLQQQKRFYDAVNGRLEKLEADAQKKAAWAAIRAEYAQRQRAAEISYRTSSEVPEAARPLTSSERSEITDVMATMKTRPIRDWGRAEVDRIRAIQKTFDQKSAWKDSRYSGLTPEDLNLRAEFEDALNELKARVHGAGYNGDYLAETQGRVIQRRTIARQNESGQVEHLAMARERLPDEDKIISDLAAVQERSYNELRGHVEFYPVIKFSKDLDQISATLAQHGITVDRELLSSANALSTAKVSSVESMPTLFKDTRTLYKLLQESPGGLKAVRALGNEKLNQLLDVVQGYTQGYVPRALGSLP